MFEGFTKKNCLKCTHPQATQDRMSLFLHQIWRNAALHHFTNGCSAVNGCRQNESKQLIKTSQ